MACELESQHLFSQISITTSQSDGDCTPPPAFNQEYSSLPTLSPERNWKIVFSVILTVSLIILFTIYKLVPLQNKYHMFAYLLIILILIWNIVFYAVIFTSNQLHMIYVKRKRVNYSQLLFIPYGYVENEHGVLLSVSAVNAIIGSNAERSALLTMYTTFGITYCAVSVKWCEQTSLSSTFTSLDIELILMMINAIGLLMIATWQVEPKKVSYVIHYLAAVATVISSPAAFLMQQNFSPFSICVVVMTYFGLFEWLILYSFLPKTHKDVHMVHRYSMISIINEAVVLMMAYACGVLFIYNL